MPSGQRPARLQFSHRWQEQCIPRIHCVVGPGIVLRRTYAPSPFTAVSPLPELRKQVECPKNGADMFPLPPPCTSRPGVLTLFGVDS